MIVQFPALKILAQIGEAGWKDRKERKLYHGINIKESSLWGGQETICNSDGPSFPPPGNSAFHEGDATKGREL